MNVRKVIVHIQDIQWMLAVTGHAAVKWTIWRHDDDIRTGHAAAQALPVFHERLRRCWQRGETLSW